MDSSSYEKKPAKKNLYYRKRAFGMSSLDRTEVNRKSKFIKDVQKLMLFAADDSGSDMEELFEDLCDLQDSLCEEIRELEEVDPRIHDPLPPVHRKYRTIDSFDDTDIRQYFRFETKDQLHRLVTGFRFPEELRSGVGNKFSGEEILLCGIYRLHSVNALGDAGWQAIFGMVQSVATMACNLFFEYMWKWWSYLLFDHVRFWVDRIPAMAEAIRLKLEQLDCYFPPGTFRVFGFIDNTMNATCRPGGGPAQDGIRAPRNDPEIQRAWYNGWKKLHGLKWQTIDLPNGMNFKVDGPFSCRDNDLTTLNISDVLVLLEALLNVYGLQGYRIYGDSAYVVINDGPLLARHQGDALSPREVLENRTMSSCRETIEWDYGDIGRYFKLLDYKHVLQIRKMPVAKMCISAFILRNALVTMNGCNTSEYYTCIPPSFEEWVGEGPREFNPEWCNQEVDVNGV